MVGGYHAPVECYIQIDPNPKNVRMTSLQEQQSNDTRARLISFPPVAPRDILVEADNKGGACETSTLLNDFVQFFIKNWFFMNSRGDIEYNLPVNVDLKNLQSSRREKLYDPQNVEKWLIPGHPLFLWSLSRRCLTSSRRLLLPRKEEDEENLVPPKEPSKLKTWVKSLPPQNRPRCRSCDCRANPPLHGRGAFLASSMGALGG